MKQRSNSHHLLGAKYLLTPTSLKSKWAKRIGCNNENFAIKNQEVLFMKFIRTTQIIFLCLCLSFSPLVVSAHGHGGHHSSSRSSSSGSHHYDHGMGPHLHTNGVCPYSTSAGTKSNSKYYNTSTIRKVQRKLNKLGYKCGRADGHCGTKTKRAIKKYQRKKCIAVNGKINKTLLKKLKITK